LLHERAYRAFSLWDSSLLHHLPVTEKPEPGAGAAWLL
jgi:hypothetical protein